MTTRFNNVAFARELAKAKRLGLTAKEISRQSRVPTYKITGWKLGRLIPTWGDLTKVTNVLDTPAEIFWEEVKPVATQTYNKDEEDLAVFKALASSLHVAQNVASLCKLVFDLWYKENFPQC